MVKMAQGYHLRSNLAPDLNDHDPHPTPDSVGCTLSSRTVRHKRRFEALNLKDHNKYLARIGLLHRVNE